jgi:hypothetical protein
MLIRYGQHNLGSERSLATDNTIFVVNVNSLWTTQFDNENLFTKGNTIWQQNLIRCSQHNFSSEHFFATDNTISTANSDSL